MLISEYYNDFFELGQQKINFSFFDPFMRMKEDHMLNGQLKPAYNVQIDVENYFIIHSHVSNDRTDYNTLIPVMEKHRKAFGEVLEEVTADSGYCSEKNLLYLKKNRISSYIKLQDHEKRKTRAYKEDIGKYYNMTCRVFEDEHYYNKYNAGKDNEKNKDMKINERWKEPKEESCANILNKKGILKRQIRSIQTEGHFGDIKENENFRRFNYRSSEKAYKEFMLYVIGQNINKYHRFLHEKIEKFEGKKEL